MYREINRDRVCVERYKVCVCGVKERCVCVERLRGSVCVCRERKRVRVCVCRERER